MSLGLSYQYSNIEVKKSNRLGIAILLKMKMGVNWSFSLISDVFLVREWPLSLYSSFWSYANQCFSSLSAQALATHSSTGRLPMCISNIALPSPVFHLVFCLNKYGPTWWLYVKCLPKNTQGIPICDFHQSDYM